MPCFGFVPNPKFTEFLSIHFVWDVFDSIVLDIGPNKNIYMLGMLFKLTNQILGVDFWEKSLESMDLSKLCHLVIVEKVQSTTSALCKKIL